MHDGPSSREQYMPAAVPGVDEAGQRGFWQDRPVLVTGAGGFIGSHLTEALAALGARVRAFLRYSSSHGLGHLTGRTESLELILGDLRDPEAVERAVRGVEFVFHLGALISIPYSYENPGAYVETNLRGTYHVLEACRRQDIDRCLLTSTSEVYGSARYTPIDEAHPLVAQSPYAATKIGADKLGESYWRSFGLPVTVVRPFNTYGPRQSLRAVIPQVLSQLLAGDEIILGNVAPRRDFLYVADTVAGFLAAAASRKTLGEAVNLGTGRDISIAELVALAGEILGRRPRVRQEEDRARPETSEVFRLRACIDKARELIGWQPRVELAEGLKQTASWLAGREAGGVGYQT